MKATSTKANSTNLIFIVLILLFVGFACQNSGKNTTARIEPAVNIPLLVGKSSLEVEEVLGAAVKVIDIPDGPDSPGEYREYRVLDNRGTLTIRYFRGKPARFICDFTPDFRETNDEQVLAALFGFDVRGKAAQKIGGPYKVMFWQGNFNGITFQDVRATWSEDGKGFGEFRATP